MQFRIENQTDLTNITLYSSLTKDLDAAVKIAEATGIAGSDAVVTLTASVDNGDALGCYLSYDMGNPSAAWLADGTITVLARG